MLESSIKNALSNYASYAQNDMVLARIERDLNNIFGDDVIRDVSFVGDRISVEYDNGIKIKIVQYP